MRRLIAVILICLSFGPDATGSPTYSVDTEIMDAARSCRFLRNGAMVDGPKLPDGGGEGEPVLLLHGSDVTREQNWEWGYWQALPRAGVDVCWVALPLAALGDIQSAAEYAARAIELMSAETGELVDVLGHSTGTLIGRWALRYLSASNSVDDYVSLAGPHHGSGLLNIETADGQAYPAYWQMRIGSRFIDAINRGDETPGDPSYTSLYTLFDTFVFPSGTQELQGAANIRLQDVCPARPVEHLTMALDGLTYLLVMDALTNPGPADAARLGADRCLATLMPAVDTVPTTSPDYTGLEETDSEPELRPYAAE